MLQTLRDKTSGWIATVILGLLIVPFAFVGVEDYFRASSDQNVARIGVPPSWWPSAPSWWPVSVFWDHEDITQAEFRERLELVRQQARIQQGDQFDARAFDSAENRRRVLEALIDQRVQQLWGEQRRVTVSDSMVRKAIADIPAFQVDGKFNLQQYRLALASAQPPRSEVQFEREIRDELQQRLVPTAVAGSNFTTPAELQRLIELLGERRDVSLIELPAPPADTSPVTDEQVAAWYKAHQQDYRAPETVTVEYIDLDAAAMPAPQIDEAALRQRYEQEKSRYTQAEERMASHILVKVDAGAAPAAVEAARKKAADLAAQARSGADFAALARANSDDTGSREAGGDLGPIVRGTMPGPFEDALFSMQPGQVSEPVRTDFGWHVIKLGEVKAGQAQSFEQARAALAQEMAEGELERSFNDLTTRVVDATLKNPGSLATAARAAGVPVQSAGPFARGQAPGVLASPAVQRAAFAESAIQDGMVSDPIEVAPNHSVLLRVVAHSPERMRPLAEVRPQVVAAIHSDRQRKAAEQRADAIVEQLRAGTPLAQVASAQGLPAPQVVAGMPRGTPLVNESVPRAVFALMPGSAKVLADAEVLPDGRAIVFVVDKVTPGTPDEVPPAQRETLKRQIAALRGEADVAAMLRLMRRGMRIEVHEANL